MMNEVSSVDTYLQSLMQENIRQLTTKEEHDLAERIQQGDRQALNKLVKHNLRFVVHVITKSSA
jgi:RNA polymerase primary sigma factor